jgi:AraC family transcriptional regulator
MVYFQDPGLQGTLAKIEALLKQPAETDAAYGETLSMLPAIEIDRLQKRGSNLLIPESGRLSVAQDRLVRDYIAENLHANISLSDLAGLVQLSRFHFARSRRRPGCRPTNTSFFVV